MTEESKIQSPTSLGIEYRSTRMVLASMLAIALMIGFLTAADAWANPMALVMFAIVLVMSAIAIRSASRKSALVISDRGIDVHDKHHFKWEDVVDLYLKEDDSDGSVIETLVIKTKIRNFKFSLSELDVERERLVPWVQFYKSHLRRRAY